MWDSTMQAQTNMLSQQYLGSAQANNTMMDNWMSMTAGVDTEIGTMHNFEDSLNFSAPSAYAVPPDPMNWS